MEEVILKFFESIRCVPLDVVFGFFSLVGESAVLAAALFLVYWLASPETGELFAVSVLTSVPVNVSLKYAVRRPRPYAAEVVSRRDVDTPVFSTRDLGDDVSFPSGHAQTAACLAAAVSLRAKRAWVWTLSALSLLLVMVSRLYFGVHYPTDVLAGALIGVLIALFWKLVYAKFHGARYYLLCAFAVLALIPLFFTCPHDYVQAAGLISGAAFFLPLCDMIRRDPSPFPKRLWRVPLGLVAAGAAFALSLCFPADEGFHLLKWFLIVGAATLGAQALFRLCKV